MAFPCANNAVDYDILWTIVTVDFRPLAAQIELILKKREVR